MGRRSINTTKSGKFMNPTDQARKEARKRELKKNKRQRMMVRQAVLKNKDPATIIMELKALDLMEFDPVNPPPYNIKVLHEKRRKLKETWERVMKLYAKEEPTKVNEMKAMETDYEQRRHELCSYYESVIQAQRVKVDEIPLPELPTNQPCLTPSYMISPSDIPLPPGNGYVPPATPPVNTAAVAAATAAAAAVVASKPEIIQQQMKGSSAAVKGILKKQQSEIDVEPIQPKISGTRWSTRSTHKKPPGPPPGAPPVLSDYSSDSSDSDTERLDGVKAGKRVVITEKPKKIRFADPMPAQSTFIDQQPNQDQFDPSKLANSHRQVITSDSTFYRQQLAMAAAAAARSAINRSAVSLPQLSELMNRRNPTDMMQQAQDPIATYMNPTVMIRGDVRLPMAMQQLNQGAPSSFSVQRPAVVVVDPTLSKQVAKQPQINRTGIIEAKPQIRNRMASITKLVPTVLKVKRAEQKGNDSNISAAEASRRVLDSSGTSVHSRKTDLAYDAFMKEMEGVLR